MLNKSRHTWMVVRGAAEPLPLIYQDVFYEYLGKYFVFESFFVTLIENVVKRRGNMETLVFSSFIYLRARQFTIRCNY